MTCMAVAAFYQCLAALAVKLTDRRVPVFEIVVRHIAPIRSHPPFTSLSGAYLCIHYLRPTGRVLMPGNIHPSSARQIRAIHQ